MYWYHMPVNPCMHYMVPWKVKSVGITWRKCKRPQIKGELSPRYILGYTGIHLVQIEKYCVL